MSEPERANAREWSEFEGVAMRGAMPHGYRGHGRLAETSKNDSSPHLKQDLFNSDPSCNLCYLWNEVIIIRTTTLHAPSF